jgi:hypothetical protein
MTLGGIFNHDTVLASVAGFNMAASVSNLASGHYAVAAATSIASALLLGWVATTQSTPGGPAP